MRTLNTVGAIAVVLGVTTLADPVRCSAAVTDNVRRIEVDGITGAVAYPADWSRIAYNGESVVVAVVKANLIKYRYAIKPPNKAPLVAQYAIVGAANTADSLADLKMVTSQNASTAEAMPAAIRPGYVAAIATLNDLTRKANRERWKIDRSESALNSQIEDCAWPATFKMEVDTYRDFVAKALGTAGDAVASFDTILNDVRKASGASIDKEALDSASSQRSAAMELVRTLEKERERATALHDALRHQPCFERTITIDTNSNTYSVDVTRELATSTAATANDPTFATVEFQSHAWSRMGVAIGVAAIAKPESHTYDVVTAADGRKIVQQSGPPPIDLKPVASIQWYPNRIDALESRRPPKFLLLAGSEVSSSPQTYLLGCGWDFVGGALVTLGFTKYTRTSLAAGWSVGQEVPVINDKQLITTVPTRSKDALGYFIGFQFRPAIFSRFGKLLKP